MINVPNTHKPGLVLGKRSQTDIRTHERTRVGGLGIMPILFFKKVKGTIRSLIRNYISNIKTPLHIRGVYYQNQPLRWGLCARING